MIYLWYPLFLLFLVYVSGVYFACLCTFNIKAINAVHLTYISRVKFHFCLA